MKMRWIEVEQNTDEWMNLRAGRAGSSDMATVMAHYGKAFGSPAQKLSVNLAVEQITGRKIESGFTNAHMMRGHAQEPIAKALYEAEFFCEVLPGGYYIADDYFGVSPDGRVGEEGLAEIKSVVSSVHYETVKRGGVDPAYKWQVIQELRVSNRRWLDYVTFCAEYPEGKRLYVHRVLREDLEEEFEQIRIRSVEFRHLVDEKRENILKWRCHG